MKTVVNFAYEIKNAKRIHKNSEYVKRGRRTRVDAIQVPPFRICQLVTIKI